MTTRIYRTVSNPRVVPYLSPADVLRRFSRFSLSTVRPAVPEDERFVRGQVGSMASTLRFLAGELEGRERAVAEQERALRAALDDVAEVVDDDGSVGSAVVDARERLDDDGGDDAARTATERERTLLAAADDVLASIDEELDDEAARAARRPLYRFLDVRLEAQHRMLGRRDGGSSGTEGRTENDPGDGDDGEVDGG